MSAKKSAADLLREVRAQGEWNAACSYGCHEWVRGAVIGDGRFLKGCANCDATYFCGEREWERLT